jgi:hypothetical protein
VSPVDQFAASLAEAREPLVLALDVRSTATRGATYDATGRPAGKRAKLAHAFTTYTDGTSQIHRDQVYDEVELSCYSSSTRQSFNNAPGRGCTPATSLPACCGCRRCNRSWFGKCSGGCRWASTSSSGCSARPPRELRPPRGQGCSTAEPGSGTATCSRRRASTGSSSPRAGSRHPERRCRPRAGRSQVAGARLGCMVPGAR